MNKPFFQTDLFGNEIKSKEKTKKEYTQEELCEKCQKYKTCLSPKIKPKGKGKKQILIITEFITKEEDEQGFLNNKAGKYLQETLKELDINLFEDCYIIPAIRCKSKGIPTNSDIKLCKGNLLREIEILLPKKIITFGKIALESLIGHKESVTTYEQWIGFNIPDQEYKCFIYPIYSPSYILHNEKEVILQKIFRDNLYNAINDNRKFKILDYKNNICIIRNKNRIIEFLQYIKDNDIITFDYETNSLRPQYKNSKIVCISICINRKSYAFMINNDEEIILELKQIFENEKIYKICQNANFENSWTKNIFKCDIKNWYWDTMICSHILDNRQGITGLKRQTYLNFGIKGYDDSISKFLKSSSNYNNIEKANQEQLLYYCALDSYFTYLLYEKQKQKLDNDIHLKKGFEFFMEGLRNLFDVHLNGIKFDKEAYQKNYNILTDKINLLHNEIMNSKEVKLWKEDNFNYDSSKQLRVLLFDICKWEIKGETKTGLQSVDANSLKLYDKRLTNNILEKRSLTKMRDTYLSQFDREEINDFLYPIFNLHTVSSYRPSTSFPNMANIPKRNEVAKDMIRETIIAKNDYLVEIDYSGIEVMVAACMTKDSNLINYINDEDTDMHRDTAADIFYIDKEKVTKDLRYIAKNKFVFPQFYGDYYVNCANNIWEYCTEDQKKILYSFISSKQEFENHIKQVEYIFWNERFKEYNEWKKANYNFYLENGYIEFKTGFRATGYMRRNQVNNLAFQGQAFHLLLWSLCKINKYLKENNYKTKIINQIYDCIVFDVCESEWEELLLYIKNIMLNEIRKNFEWIIIPLNAKVTYYGKNWADEIKEEDL